MNKNHILIAFGLVLAALVVLMLAPGTDATIGGRLGVVDALTGLLLILGGGVAGSQVPKG